LSEILYGDYMEATRKTKIWRGLVDYVNAADQISDAVILGNFARTLFESMPWMARTAYEDAVPKMIALLTNPEALFEHVDGKRVWMYFESEEQIASKFRQQAIEYQPQVRQLLRWLSDPERNGRDLPQAFAFLREHTKHIEFQRGDPAFAPEEVQYRYFDPGPKGELKDNFPFRTLSYKDVADVVCDFVHKEHEAGRDVPIRTCKRPGCGKLVIHFKKREYCRTTLCDRERQRRDDNLKQKKNRDNVFVSRLRRLPPAIRRKKALENLERLRQIERDWQNKCESLAKHALELLAMSER
jgi:hypothetical protein